MAKRRTITKETVPAQSRFSEKFETVKAKINENSEKLRELQSKAHDKMSENPMQTAAIAFGVGIICGVGLKLLIDSKRRD